MILYQLQNLICLSTLSSEVCRALIDRSVVGVEGLSGKECILNILQ
jgi:hypothetical protein